MDYHFYVWDEINDVMSKRFNRLFSKILGDESQNRHLIIPISSSGGEVEAGFSIYDFIEILKNHGVNVTTVVYGKAYSFATILALTGNDRVCTKHSLFMFHPISMDVPPDYLPHHKSLTDITVRSMDSISKIIQGKLKLSKKNMADFLTKMNSTLWLDSSEAMSLKIVNSVME